MIVAVYCCARNRTKVSPSRFGSRQLHGSSRTRCFGAAPYLPLLPLTYPCPLFTDLRSTWAAAAGGRPASMGRGPDIGVQRSRWESTQAPCGQMGRPS